MDKRTLLLFLLGTQQVLSSKTSEDKVKFKFLAQPGNVSVLESTMATFEWIVALENPKQVSNVTSVPGDTSILWRFFGTEEQPREKNLLLVERGAVRFDWITYTKGYFSYKRFPGSAVMILGDAELSDQGKYAVFVYNKTAPNEYRQLVLEDTSMLTVFAIADVKFNVSVEGRLRQFSIFIDGTNITLPVTYVTSNVVTTVGLAFEIDRRLPSSHLINVTTPDGRSEEICTGGYTCDREIVLSFDSERQENVITSEIILNIQNVADINVHIPIDFNLYESFRFLSNPGNLYVLENTTVIFNWTIALWTKSSVGDPRNLVNIAWRYLGTPQEPKHQDVLTYTPAKQYVWPGDKHGRVGYLEYPGSAAIMINNVNKKDSGVYKVIVSNKKQQSILEDHSILQTIQVSDVHFDISVNDKIYPVRVNVSGVNVTLQTASNLTVPGYVELSVTYPLSLPRPDVTITHSGSPQKTMTCEGFLRCDKGIFLHEWYAEQESFMIQLVLDFKIQNFDKVSVRLPIALHRKPTPDRPGGVSIFTFMGIVFLVSSVCAIIQVFVIDR